MKIVQITDLHIGRPGEDTYGVDVRGNFEAILSSACARQPQRLIVSGDLCYRDGDASIYTWVKAKLDGTGVPYIVISGNHDDPVLMAEVFGLKDLLQEKELYFTKDFGGQPVLFLDTTTGRVSDAQQAWLRDQLAQQRDQEAVVFMHHPPVQGGVPFMDERHPLQNREEVQTIFFEHPQNVSIFTGHYHAEKTIRQRNIVVHITPSCFFQIGQRSAGFEVDHYRIGLREINWHDGLLMNTVHYL